MFEPHYDHVYGSAIFTTTAKKCALFRANFPNAIVGGTGSGGDLLVEDIAGEHRDLDYTASDVGFDASLGFTQRGCRFKCGFCVVPKKEGAPASVSTIPQIWRGAPHPRHLHLLDNDFFGQPKADWKARLSEIREGGFKVCFNQGINVRVITDEIAEDLTTVEYRDNEFRRRRLYTAWDNLGDERLFMRGIDRLERSSVTIRRKHGRGSTIASTAWSSARSFPTRWSMTHTGRI
jgi:hypothetical protein